LDKLTYLNLIVYIIWHCAACAVYCSSQCSGVWRLPV